jgi:hypothetical protein
MIQLPDLSNLLPVAGLAAIAVVCIAALLLRSLLHSRVAMLIAVVAGIVIAGPALAGALTSIVWALVPLGVVVVAGIVVVLWLLHRNPELLSLARDVVPRKAPPAQQMPLELPAPSSAVVINQPRETTAATPQRARTAVLRGDGDRWGF